MGGIWGQTVKLTKVTKMELDVQLQVFRHQKRTLKMLLTYLEAKWDIIKTWCLGGMS